MDPLILAALAVAGICLFWAMFGGKRPQVAAPIRRPHPGRALIDHFEEVGKDSAGRLIAERLGLVEADAIAEKFGKAFSKPIAPSTTSAASPPVPNP